MFHISIQITSNNILITLSNEIRKPIFVVSSGHLVPKLKGRKKVSTVAARLLGNLAAKKLKLKKCSLATVYVFGNLRRRKVILSEFWKMKISITEIIDLTPLPHNGCRLKKRKRI